MLRPAATFALFAALLSVASGCSSEAEEARGSAQGAVGESEMLLLCPGLDAAHHVESGTVLERGESYRCVIERCARGFANLEVERPSAENPGFFDDRLDGCETSLLDYKGPVAKMKSTVEFDVDADGAAKVQHFRGKGAADISIRAREVSRLPHDLDVKVTLSFRSPMTFEMTAAASGMRPCWDAAREPSPDHVEGAVVDGAIASRYPELEVPQTRMRTMTMRLHVSERLMRDNSEWYTIFIKPRGDATALGDVSFAVTIESGQGVGGDIAPHVCPE